MEIERKRNGNSFISIAPLIDIVFLLLLFFLLTSHLIQESSIEISLPESTTARAREDIRADIQITGEGAVYLAGIRTEVEGLGEAISRQMQTDAISIRADRTVDVGLLVEVIDQVRLSGIRDYSIITERR